MKIIEILLLIINFYFSFQSPKLNLNRTYKIPKIICSVDKIKSIVKPHELTDEQIKNISKKRNLDDNYDTIRIYLSTKRINSQIAAFGDQLNKIYIYLNSTIDYIKKLIKVNPLNYNIKCTFTEQLNDWNLASTNGDTDKSLESGVSYDLVIFPVFTFDSTLSCKILKNDPYTKRPIVSSLSIPFNLITTTGTNAKFYIESLLLHEFTHILGFLYDSFQYFPGGLNATIENITLRGRKRYIIKTPTVLDKARKYYGCPSLSGLELEDQDENESPSSHWEARILLGEYMNLEQYEPEVVISDFTLALLEDSKWYKVNYYTGGLMRFGKNKGCKFLEDECSTAQGITTFKNEFFDFDEDENNPSCSSGRLSRTYCESSRYPSFNIQEYNRITIFNKEKYGGKTINADYCFGFVQNSQEAQNNLYLGNCKSGNGNYGSKIKYNNFGERTNGEIENELYEKYSNNSFCVLSEAYPSNLNNKYNGVIHPICYEMFCSNKTLAIKIKDQYIICPREGGKVEVNGDFVGYIYCPDYNLICTGSVICNDMFDCIEKNSTSKIPDYDDYVVTGETSSQKISAIKLNNAIYGYELDDKGICPINCAQCKNNKKCFKCRENYNLIGEKENDDKPIICDNTIDISIGYYNKNGINFPCIEFCTKCYNSNTCEKCNNIHKLNPDKTQCIDKVENCETYENIDFNCTKCKNGFAFIGKDRNNCYYITNKEKYYTLDNGISYYPCDTNIKNCDECDNKSDSCKKCKTNYYFIEYNRTFCFNNIDLSKYYSNDNNISYHLCNKTIANCHSCSHKNSNLKCDLCEKDYYFIEDNRDTCFNNYNLSKYYSDDNNVSFYPCHKGFPHCEVCNNNKNKCQKCFDNYYFIGINKEKCETITDIYKYFTEDNGISYLPCDTDMEGCEKCTNRTQCTLCKNDYYFIEHQRNKCYYKINLESYYKEGDSYFPCNKSIEFCNKCIVKDSCIECNTNYYFIGNDRTTCKTGDNLKKYYSNDNGISYFLCSSKMPNCDECFNENFCYLCYSSYFLKYENSKDCFLESELKKAKTYYRLNGTHYRKCSENIINCDLCSSKDECDQCFSNNYFIDNNRKTCVNIIDINIEEYYEYDQYNYYKCSWLFDNCKKCNNSMCNFCHDNYTLVNDNYKKCQPKENYKKGYYQNEKGNMYYSCIDNCDKCVNGKECIECALNYSLLADGTSCGNCIIAEVTVKDELTLENMDKLIQNYINNYKNNYDVAMVYSNPNLNYTLIVYRTWQCTELLFYDKYFRIDTYEFNEKLKKKLNKSGNSFIYSILHYNYKSYFEVYDIDINKKLDIQNDCPECLRVEYEIKNNYISEINHILGNKLSKIVSKYNINVLNSSDPFFNEPCKNVEMESIDLSIEQRRSALYLGNNLKTITCLDDDCTLNSILYNESLGLCSCKLNFDFDKLLNNNTSNNYDLNEDEENTFNPISGINPLPIFKCYDEAFNSKNISSNVGLYIGCVVIFIQIISFIFLFIKYCIRKKIVKNISSPPPKNILTIKKKSVYRDDTEKETQAKDKDYDSYYDSADTEKKVQNKDEDEIDEESEGNNYILNSRNYNKNTEVLSEENSFNEKKHDISLTQRKFNFEEINPDDAVNNFSKLSEIKHKTSYGQNNNSTLSKNSSSNSLDLSEDEIFTLIKNNKEKLDLDYINLNEAIKRDNRTICELYAHLLALKQPIWDMLSDIKALQINKSFIPISMKIIRFFFILSFNMFINSLFLTQNYFKKKYTYFNNKYNIQYDEESKKISSNEKFAYAIKNTIAFSISTFIICLVIQFIINYCFFNIRKKIWIILKECDDDKKEEIKEMNKFFNDKNCFYIILAIINFVFMIFFFFYIINFSEAFKGGIIDYLGGTFMTWLFLQVIPFISCIISSLFRYYGLKNQNNRLYKLNQVYIY